MGKLLDRVMVEASKLPDDEQEAFAAFMLAELESERRWDELFSLERESLEKLVGRITPENRHSETDTGRPVGDEVW